MGRRADALRACLKANRARLIDPFAPYKALVEQATQLLEGGRHTVLVALIQKDGDIYNEKFLTKLKAVTDDIFFLPGIDRSRGRSLVEIELHIGRNRIVRRILDHVGHPVVELTRTAFGPLRLGDLSLGTTRELSRDELGALFDTVDE